ncbi:hypothetical protein EKO04_003948 [Ascochyta lentis]|uniref:Xylanolytic transcriptional activator regulatory domain-containing protein n=1 Tax=Ascochyta lentis TaxID=205686 RepID=A0A8H7J7S9_9PLEO|nr:hypothetical protein EKO04_003948 [Ascochyta lentis]
MHNLEAVSALPSPEIIAASQPQSYADFAPASMAQAIPMVAPFDAEVDCLNGTFDVDPIMEPPDGMSLDFLWSNTYRVDEFLPAAFFNTDYSLTQLSESRTDMRQADCVGQQLPTVYCPPQISGPSIMAPNSTQGVTGGHVNTTFPIEWPLDPELHAADEADLACPWRISSSAYEQLQSTFAPYRKLLSANFSVPSRYTLSRFLEGYFRGFHEHLPFLHMSTISPATMAPELLLAIASVGALYKFEHAKGYALYFAAKTIINRKLHVSRQLMSDQLMASSPKYVNFGDLQPATAPHVHPSVEEPNIDTEPSPDAVSVDQEAEIRTMQALLILTAMSSWADKPLVPEALEMAGYLAVLTRRHGISVPEKLSTGVEWPEWIAGEERRRTLSVAYIIFNLQSIAFNVPPMIFNQEVAIFLPSSGKEWKATTAIRWRRARAEKESQGLSFQATLRRLLRGEQIQKSFQISAFGNYILIHAIVQQIFFERHACSYQTSESPTLRVEALKAFEAALRAWQQSWETTCESTLDPMSPKGPMGFNSTAVLRIAYARLNADLGPNLKLDSRDPHCIARSFMDESVQVLIRSAHVDRAVLQCIHALSIPVRKGIPFVARTHTQHWSIVHSLANLECAFLLGRWLAVVAECVRVGGINVLREDERKLLRMLRSLVLETDLGTGFRDTDDEFMAIRKLAAYTICLWAEIFKGVHVFQVVHVVGTSFAMVGEYLRLQLES